MLTRVRDFETAYGTLLPASAQLAFAAVATGIKELEAHDVAESSASVRARATRKAAARKALLERLILIAKAAQLLPNQDAAFRAHFAVPHGAGDQALLTTARQFVERGAPLAAPFIERGMPAAFPRDLEELIGGFEAALRDRGMSRDERRAARVRIQASLASALNAVGALDVMVATHLAPDSEARQVWTRSKRVSYRGRSRKDAAAAPTEPAASPAPAPSEQSESSGAVAAPAPSEPAAA